MRGGEKAPLIGKTTKYVYNSATDNHILGWYNTHGMVVVCRATGTRVRFDRGANVVY